MTQDLDLLCTYAQSVAEALCDSLRERFHVAVCIQRIADGRGLRVFQARKTGNRHLVDVRSVDVLPEAERIAGVLVLAPADLIASKVIAYHQRRGQPKSGTDWRDVALLLLTFPDLKRDPGLVSERLRAAGAAPEAHSLWRDIVAQEIKPSDDEAGY